MKKTLITIGLAAFMFASCGGGKMSLTAYNEKVVNVFEANTEYLTSNTEKIFENKLGKEENQKLIAAFKSKLDSNINMMNGLKFPDDAKAFHESMLTAYSYQKDSLLPLLSKTQECAPEGKEWFDIWTEFDKRTERANTLVTKVSSIQEEVAKKAGMELR